MADEAGGAGGMGLFSNPMAMMGLAMMQPGGMQQMLPMMMRYGMMGGFKRPGMGMRGAPATPAASMPMSQYGPPGGGVGMQPGGGMGMQPGGGMGMQPGGGQGLQVPPQFLNSGLMGAGEY